MRVLPVYKGYTVDNRLKQFRRAPIGELVEFIEFDSEQGRMLYDEMVEQGLNFEPMEHDTELGQQYLRDLNEATYGEQAA